MAGAKLALEDLLEQAIDDRLTAQAVPAALCLVVRSEHGTDTTPDAPAVIGSRSARDGLATRPQVARCLISTEWTAIDPSEGNPRRAASPPVLTHVRLDVRSAAEGSQAVLDKMVRRSDQKPDDEGAPPGG
jgi:hypothetical protein